MAQHEDEKAKLGVRQQDMGDVIRVHAERSVANAHRESVFVIRSA